uniref:Uncharacterized protein n=1 Tax=Oryza meridionalis TaxID=40149 RepID=A0A0E0DE51_9ORYZ
MRSPRPGVAGQRRRRVTSSMAACWRSASRRRGNLVGVVCLARGRSSRRWAHDPISHAPAPLSWRIWILEQRSNLPSQGEGKRSDSHVCPTVSGMLLKYRPFQSPLDQYGFEELNVETMEDKVSIVQENKGGVGWDVCFAGPDHGGVLGLGRSNDGEVAIAGN